MSVEAPGLSISAPGLVSPTIGPSIGPSFSPTIGLEAGTTFGPSFSPSADLDKTPSLGGITGNFSLREIMLMPELQVDASNFHMDRPIPVQKMAFDDRLFETLTRVDQIPKQPNTEILHLFELPEHSLNLENIGANTLSPIPCTIFNPDYFEVLSPFPPQVHQEGSSIATSQNTDETQTETFFPYDIKPRTQEQSHADLQTTTVSDIEAVEPNMENLAANLADNNLSLIDQITEAEVDNQAIKKIQAIIEDQSFPAEQEAAWKEKFALIASEKETTRNQALPQVLDNKEPQANLITQPKVETTDQTDVDNQPQAQTETVMETPPPNPPTTAALNESYPDEEGFKVEENIWDVYSIDRKWVIAQDILKSRFNAVSQAVQGNHIGFSPADSLRGTIAGMDIPTPQQALKIAGGELVIPQVVAKIDRALDLVDVNNTQEVAKTAQEIIQENAPSQSNRRVNLVDKVKQSALLKPARILAEKGAKFIVLRRINQKWQETNKLHLNEPLELEKVKKSNVSV